MLLGIGCWGNAAVLMHWPQSQAYCLRICRITWICGRHDIQLLRSHRTDLGQSGAIMGANQLLCAQFVNDLHPGQGLGQFPAPAFVTAVCRNDDFVIF